MRNIIGVCHETLALNRRARVLAEHFISLVPRNVRVLDVGCGDGSIDYLIMRQRPDLVIEGIDVLVRPQARIPVKSFDGKRIPYPDASFDAVLFVDVLHHTEDPIILLREATRVSTTILIKDHFRDGLFANATLRLMDWVGNAHHGVVLPYNYWSRVEWSEAFDELSLKVDEMRFSLRLYPLVAAWVFERRLHFIARLTHADKRISAP